MSTWAFSHADVSKERLAQFRIEYSKVPYGTSELRYAIQTAGFEDVAEHLINHASQDALNAYENPTPLALTVQLRKYRLMDLLLQRGADATTALLTAVGMGDVLLADKLLKAGASTRDSGYSNPLKQACGKGDLPMVALLLNAGANANYRGMLCDSAIVYAIYAYDNNPEEAKEIVKLLLDYGCDPIGLATPLHDWHLFDKSNLHFAAHRNAVGIAEILIQTGVPVDINVDEGLTPLHQALQSGRNEMIQCLISHGANVNYAARLNPNEPVTIFCDCGFYTINILNLSVDRCSKYTKIILENGANPNAVDQFGITPLLTAVNRCSIDHARLLLSFGASPNQVCIMKRRDQTGREVSVTKSPIELAKELGDDEMLCLLLRGGKPGK